MSKRICLGAIAGAHGVRGEFKVKSFTARPEDIAVYGPLESEKGDRHFTLALVRPAKPTLFVARAPEIKTREEAEDLKGTKLFVSRDMLPPPDEDEFYYEDLVGLSVQTVEGKPYGKVKAVLNHGAGDILEISQIPDIKGTGLIPFTRQDVPTIDFASGVVVVVAPLLDMDEPEDAPPESKT
ncbi:ribosome maturation factor RimM [Parvularcula sp. IMCC14364]|uniref:ribosome maturation factor RimM n=1 Tax=Parvularcula sp. IMCC14364 TaxID=3067902 RepID=UPI00274071F9|nr:ribosome maturation factor RimM [Parvularcula sp. IMCC14364]